MSKYISQRIVGFYHASMNAPVGLSTMGRLETVSQYVWSVCSPEVGGGRIGGRLGLGGGWRRNGKRE
jgi:hypothetical protein